MCRNQTLNFINVSLQESSSLHWCSDLPAASSLDRCALNSMWTPSSLTPVSWMCPYSVILSCVLFLACAVYWPTPCLPAGKLNITPEDPRWIGAWWAGFLLCGALLFCSAVLMFGFPQSLPAREREEGADSEQVMLPPSLSSDCETPKPSNGVVVNHEPANSPTCCQQLRGEHAASSVVLQFFFFFFGCWCCFFNASMYGTKTHNILYFYLLYLPNAMKYWQNRSATVLFK